MREIVEDEARIQWEGGMKLSLLGNGDDRGDVTDGGKYGGH